MISRDLRSQWSFGMVPRPRLDWTEGILAGVMWDRHMNIIFIATTAYSQSGFNKEAIFVCTRLFTVSDL